MKFVIFCHSFVFYTLASKPQWTLWPLHFPPCHFEATSESSQTISSQGERGQGEGEEESGPLHIGWCAMWMDSEVAQLGLCFCCCSMFAPWVCPPPTNLWMSGAWMQKCWWWCLALWLLCFCYSLCPVRYAPCAGSSELCYDPILDAGHVTNEMLWGWISLWRLFWDPALAVLFPNLSFLLSTFLCLIKLLSSSFSGNFVLCYSHNYVYYTLFLYSVICSLSDWKKLTWFLRIYILYFKMKNMMYLNDIIDGYDYVIFSAITVLCLRCQKNEKMHESDFWWIIMNPGLPPFRNWSIIMHPQETSESIGTEEPAEGVYFIKQTISNACGTIGLIHALCNNKDTLGFDRESLFPLSVPMRVLSLEFLLEQPRSICPNSWVTRRKCLLRIVENTWKRTAWVGLFIKSGWICHVSLLAYNNLPLWFQGFWWGTRGKRPGGADCGQFQLAYNYLISAPLF